MSEHGPSFDRAQRAHDQAEPEYIEAELDQIEYDFYADEPKHCQHEPEKPKIGSVHCQMCKHLMGFQKNYWIKCDVNAGENESGRA